MWRLPISEYPEVVPPTIVVRATYPGANPKTIAETVASPLEQAINGVENSLYMFSQATGDGVMTLTVTFKLGTDIDKAQVQVQNRVSQALPKLPEEVRRLGVTTTKQSPDLTMVVHLFSPNGRYDEVYLRNYATLQVKDVLARIPGAGDVQVFGSGDYAMRVWLDPDKVAARESDRERCGRTRFASRTCKSPPARSASNRSSKPVDFELQINAKGRLISDGGVRPDHRQDRAERRKDLAQRCRAHRTGRGQLFVALAAEQQNGGGPAHLPIARRQRPPALRQMFARTMEELKKNFPEGVDYSVVYDPTVFVRHSIEAVVHTLLEAILLVVIVVILFLQTWRASIIPLAAVPVSLVGTFAVMLALGFTINNLSLFGLVLAIGIVVDDAIVVVENVERNIALGLVARRRDQARDERSDQPDHRHGAGAVRGVRSDRVYQRIDRPILQTVRDHDRHLDGHLRDQFADAFARACARCCSRTMTRRRTGFARGMDKIVRLVLPSVQPRVRVVRDKYSAGVGAVSAQERHRAGGLWRAGGAHRLEL